MQNNIDRFIADHPPVLPVVNISEVDDALPIVDALYAGGINAIEITLRTSAGIDALKAIHDQRPEVFLCAGSLIYPDQIKIVADIGVDLAITPGISLAMITAAQNCGMTILPGVATPSELMLGVSQNLHYFKFFPAAAMGGPVYLHSLAQPFADTQFCPTGGLTIDNFMDYLRHDYVAFVGGSWLVTQQTIAEKNWDNIKRVAEQTISQLHT